jgi:hypothetical protein
VDGFFDLSPFWFEDLTGKNVKIGLGSKFNRKARSLDSYRDTQSPQSFN